MDEHRRKLVAIVFTDIVGFTEITSSDEGEAIRLLQWANPNFEISNKNQEKDQSEYKAA